MSNLTPKEEAIQLVEKFYIRFSKRSRDFNKILNANKHHKSIAFYNSIYCAKLCIDEIINSQPYCVGYGLVVNRWKQVKEEIKAL